MHDAYAIVCHAANVIGPRLPGSANEKKFADYMREYNDEERKQIDELVSFRHAMADIKAAEEAAES